MGKSFNNYSIFKPLLLVLFLGIVFSQNLFANELGESLPLSLQDVIEITLQNNLNIAIERLNPKINEENINLEKGFFDLVLFADTSIDKEVAPSASAFSSPDVNSAESRNFSFGFRQALKTGGSYELKLESVWNTTNSEFSGLNPKYSSFIDFDFKQPLLKGFGIGLNTRKIKVASNSQNISQMEFKKLVIQSISEVQNIYWDIVFKRDELNVKKTSLELAKDLENRVRIQVDVGVLAPIEILQAQAEVAAREEAVIITENEIKDLEDQLKTKLNFPPEAKEWGLTLVPTESLSFTGKTFYLEEFIKIALENRPEIQQLKLDINNKEIEIAYQKNQLYPTIDLVASLGLNGISGDAVTLTSFSGTTSTSRFGGSHGRSLEQAASGDFYSFDVGLKLEYPFGNRTAKSRHSVSKLEVEKALLELKNLEQQIKLEIKKAIRASQTNIKRIKVTRVSNKLAQEKLNAEEKKFGVGLSTSFKVLEFQKDMVDAQSKEIKAIVDYKKSVVLLYEVAGISLEENHVELK